MGAVFESAVSPSLSRVLQNLMSWPYLVNFALGGGTALALRYGHRESVDIDLFTTEPLDSQVVQNGLQRDFPGTTVVNLTPGSVRAYVDGVKLDILCHPYPLLEPLETREGVRLLSLRDLSPMKVNAVSGRGSKKDFTDLLLLHENGILVRQAVSNFREKYGDGGLFGAIRSLNWFEDLRDEPDPRFLNSWTWNQVEARMVELGKELIRMSDIT